MIGDMDRATHIFRSNLLRLGKTLKEATDVLRQAFGIKQRIFPMCEEDVSTFILTDEGEMHFQEFWVKRRGLPNVLDVYVKNIENAKPSEGVIEAIRDCKAVLIGPSNPVTSIMPILLVKGIKDEIRRKRVIAVSPIIGNKAVSGPAAKFLKAKGYAVSPNGVAEFYKDIIDIFVVDESDRDVKIDDVDVIYANIVMRSKEDAARLSKLILEFV